MKSTEIIQPTPLIAPIAASGLRNNIPDDATGSNYASIEEGFPEMTMKAPIDGGLPPWGQDFNGMFYLMSSQTCFLQNGGNITFNQAVSDKIGGYPQGAVLDYIDENGTFSKVRSLIDDNTYNFVTTPSYIDNVHWEQIGMTAATSWGNIGGNIENQSDLQAALDLKANKSDLQSALDLKADKTELSSYALKTDLTKYNTAYITKAWVSGKSYYILFSNKFCMQGGFSAKSSGENINFFKKMANTNFNLQITAIDGYAASGWERLSTTGFVRSADNYDAFWRVEGYVA